MSRSTAEVVREYGLFPGTDSVHGVTYDGQHVWVAAGATLQAFDPSSGAPLHAIELRRIDPGTGEVLERLELPTGVTVSGLESDGGDRFFCGGGRSGKVRTVRRPPASSP